MNWRYVIFGILGATGVLNVIVYLAASRSATALFEDHPYERGLNWDAEQADISRAKALGITGAVFVEIAKDPKSADAILVTLTKGEQPLVGAKILLEAIRPAGDTTDSEVALIENPNKPGTYQGKLKFAKLGLWWFKLVSKTPEPFIIELHQTVS